MYVASGPSSLAAAAPDACVDSVERARLSCLNRNRLRERRLPLATRSSSLLFRIIPASLAHARGHEKSETPERTPTSSGTCYDSSYRSYFDIGSETPTSSTSCSISPSSNSTSPYLKVHFTFNRFVYNSLKIFNDYPQYGRILFADWGQTTDVSY